MNDTKLLVEPVPALDRLPAYSVSRPPFEMDLVLDFNESLEPLPVTGSPPPVASANLYPWTNQLEAQLAQRLGVAAERVIVTCGADDALERSVRAVCCPDRRAVMVKPTYGMPWRYAIISGAEIVTVPWWRGPFPVDEVCAVAGDDAALLFLVSPNNPTGAVITRNEFTEVAQRLPRTLVLYDQAYREFSDAEYDLTETALDYPNVVFVRTFSKAWGGAGLRAGYAVGDARVIDWLRRIGQPFPVSSPTLDILEKTVTPDAEPSRDRVDRIRAQRDRLIEVLADLGAEPLPSQGSFVAARFADALWVRNAVASLGIAIRGFPGRSELNDWLRTTMPGDEAAFERLVETFRTVLRPEALIFDLDEVTTRFEAIYQGTDVEPGLRRHERPLVKAETLAKLAARLPLAVVTGRPRRDAERFLTDHGISDCFQTVVTMEEVPGKPDPAPVRLALERLGLGHAWMVGDTPDDIRAARAAAVLPLGIVAPGDDPDLARSALAEAGAARILTTIDELLEILP